MKNILEIENLTKMYNKDAGIENISLTLSEGKAIGIIGVSGSGKSTLLKCILNYVEHKQGKIKIFNSYLEKEYEQIMKLLGYLPDDFIDYPDTTVKNLIDYTAKFYDTNYNNEIKKLAEMLELDLDKRIYELSSGNKKKLNLLQALYHNPKLILLDEPTNFLDDLTINKLLNYLKRLKANYKSMIICSHELNFLNNICDEIYLLNNHKLTKLDKDIFNNNYKRVVLKTSVYYDYKIFMFKGVEDLEMNNNTVSFIYKNEVSLLLKYLSNLHILDINISNVTASEIVGNLINENK